MWPASTASSTGAWRQLLARALPRAGGLCAVCRGWSPHRLCVDCTQQFAPRVPRCRSCGLRVPAGVLRCGACLQAPPPFDECVALADYGFPWDRLIGQFKFARQPELAKALAQALHETAQATATPCPDLFAPVPLSARRLAERGYDQAWELARHLAGLTQRPALPRLLERRFDSRQQSMLDRQARLRNLKGAFGVPPRLHEQARGRHVALVDDVMTTGATAHEAARALRAAGVARVDLWVLARTPSPRD